MLLGSCACPSIADIILPVLPARCAGPVAILQAIQHLHLFVTQAPVEDALVRGLDSIIVGGLWESWYTSLD